MLLLHVTAQENVNSILSEGLHPRIGPLSSQLESVPAVFAFPTWEAMIDANWLFDEVNWPYETEPALICFSADLDRVFAYAGYEVVLYESIPPSRITVLSLDECKWSEAKEAFSRMGGLITSDSGLLNGLIEATASRISSQGNSHDESCCWPSL